MVEMCLSHGDTLVDDQYLFRNTWSNHQFEDLSSLLIEHEDVESSTLIPSVWYDQFIINIENNVSLIPSAWCNRRINHKNINL